MATEATKVQAEPEAKSEAKVSEISLAELMAASKQIDKNEAKVVAERQAETFAKVLKKA